jgi:hypothetical protein
MRRNMLDGLRKWRLVGLLAVVLVAITAASTTIHAFQHVNASAASTNTTGDAEVCGLCQLDSADIGPSHPEVVDVCCTPLEDAQPAELVLESPRVSSFHVSSRGPPLGA